MRIKKENIKKIRKILSDISYDPIGEKAFIFFPIESNEFKDVDGIELSLTSATEKGLKKELTPGIVLQVDRDGKRPITYTVLGYADLSYTPEFNISQYIALTGTKMSEKNLSEIRELDCYIVKSDYLLTTFNF